MFNTAGDIQRDGGVKVTLEVISNPDVADDADDSPRTDKSCSG